MGRGKTRVAGGVSKDGAWGGWGCRSHPADVSRVQKWHRAGAAGLGNPFLGPRPPTTASTLCPRAPSLSISALASGPGWTEGTVRTDLGGSLGTTELQEGKWDWSQQGEHRVSDLVDYFGMKPLISKFCRQIQRMEINKRNRNHFKSMTQL